ncbi:MAG TPA: 16S rRNA (guanine(966)-N(2))-methyltransferase RsmD [Candidatus Acidoferrales bacterium]|nr:16S rRNA (guanine(966)-N(2))-methyltransferase RsmD [Candidatus Acidoferrales bacterium]
MRVIAGIYRSRILKSLKGLALRPTSDRLRETLFNVLGAGIRGARFLDVFAGTGAVGIEALSRGADHVSFIENHASTAALIRKNLAALKIDSGGTVICADAIRGLEILEAKVTDSDTAYDYIFIDPPYAATADYSRTLQKIGACKLLAERGMVTVEHRKTFDLPESFATLKRVRVLRQGDAALSFYRRGDALQSITNVDNP